MAIAIVQTNLHPQKFKEIAQSVDNSTNHYLTLTGRMLLKNNDHKQPEEFNHRNLSPEESSSDYTKRTDTPPDAVTDDDLEFVVTEAHEEGPQFVGMSDEPSGQSDLGVESNADLMEPQADNDSTEPPTQLSLADESAQPIGTSEPILPPEPAYGEPAAADFDSRAVGVASIITPCCKTGHSGKRIGK